VPVPTSVLVPISAPVLVPVPVRAPVRAPVPVPVAVPVPVPPVAVPVPVPPVPVRVPVSKAPTKAPTNAPTKAPTKSPTKAPTKTPTEAPTPTHSLLTSFINNITLSNRTIAANGPTPEDQALKYLIEMDTTFSFSQLLELNSMMNNVVQFRIRQRYALLTLWFQQTFTNTRWSRRNLWQLNRNECDGNWEGINCASINLGGDVGTQRVVFEISLFSNNVKGTIPADLGLLTELNFLYLSGNALTGTLPASIGQWTALLVFTVSNNALTGTIPASIGNWSQIWYAYFFENNFTGTIGNSICPYISRPNGEQLEADCLTEINCTCCTKCY
jgi:hypothetical protein